MDELRLLLFTQLIHVDDAHIDLVVGFVVVLHLNRRFFVLGDVNYIFFYKLVVVLLTPYPQISNLLFLWFPRRRDVLLVISADQKLFLVDVAHEDVYRELVVPDQVLGVYAAYFVLKHAVRDALEIKVVYILFYTLKVFLLAVEREAHLVEACVRVNGRPVLFLEADADHVLDQVPQSRGFWGLVLKPTIEVNFLFFAVPLKKAYFFHYIYGGSELCQLL